MTIDYSKRIWLFIYANTHSEEDSTALCNPNFFLLCINNISSIWASFPNVGFKYSCLLAEDSSIVFMSTIAKCLFWKMVVDNQIRKSNLKVVLEEMPQIAYKSKRKIKIQSISPLTCANPLRVMCLWEDFLKENINVTNNKKFLCLLNLNYGVHLYFG